MSRKLVIYGLVALLLFIVSLVAFALWEMHKEYKSQEQVTSEWVISPSYDYVEYDPMENPSEDVRRVIQEMKCDYEFGKDTL